MVGKLQALPDIAREAGATVDQLRYWLRLLSIEVSKQGKTRMVSDESAGLLSNMARMVKEGTPPKEAATRLLASPIVPIVPAATSDSREIALVSEVVDLKKALVLMAETMATMKADLSRLVEDNQELRREAAHIHNLMIPPRRSAPWSPPPVEKKIAVQRELSIIEAVRGYFDDCLGFLLGRG